MDGIDIDIDALRHCIVTNAGLASRHFKQFTISRVIPMPEQVMFLEGGVERAALKFRNLGENADGAHKQCGQRHDCFQFWITFCDSSPRQL